MKPKIVSGNYKKYAATDELTEPVFDPNVEVETVLNQIVSDIKDSTQQEIAKSIGVSLKDVEGFNIKYAKGMLQINVSIIDGSLTEPNRQPLEKQKRIREVFDKLERFESKLRKEFRQRTGKALTFKNTKQFADCEMIALNGLYRYFAKKVGEVSTVLPRQKDFG